MRHGHVTSHSNYCPVCRFVGPVKPRLHRIQQVRTWKMKQDVASLKERFSTAANHDAPSVIVTSCMTSRMRCRCKFLRVCKLRACKSFFFCKLLITFANFYEHCEVLQLCCYNHANWMDRVRVAYLPLVLISTKMEIKNVSIFLFEQI